MEKHYIYINSFWEGFVNKTNGIHIEYFENIFKNTIIGYFKITDDINIANVLFESVFGDTLINIKKWKYTIQYSGEPYKYIPDNYTITLDSEYSANNIIDLPLCVYYINANNHFNRLLSRAPIHQVPSKFCCFIVSNGQCKTRNQIFSFLNSYKKVDSYGKYENNMNEVISYPYWSEEFIHFMGQYKFIICFENTKKGTYITEKIVNPYLANSIPIYWGTHHVKNLFNNESFLFLENESNDSYITLLNKIIELDQNDEKYLNMLNQTVFSSYNLEYWNKNYTNDCISKQLDKHLMRIK
jgi:hypothetical protein